MLHMGMKQGGIEIFLAKWSHLVNKDSMQVHALKQDWSNGSCTRTGQLKKVVMGGIDKCRCSRRRI